MAHHSTAAAQYSNSGEECGLVLASNDAGACWKAPRRLPLQALYTIVDKHRAEDDNQEMHGRSVFPYKGKDRSRAPCPTPTMLKLRSRCPGRWVRLATCDARPLCGHRQHEKRRPC